MPMNEPGGQNKPFLRVWGPPLLALLLVLSVGSGILARRAERNQMAIWQGRLTGVAEGTSRTLALWTGDREAVAAALVANPVVTRWREGGDSAAVTELLTNLQYGELVAVEVTSGARTVRVGENLPVIQLHLAGTAHPAPGTFSWAVVEPLPGIVRTLLHYTSVDGTVSTVLVRDPAVILFRAIPSTQNGTVTAQTRLVTRRQDSVVSFMPSDDDPRGIRSPSAPVGLPRLIGTAAITHGDSFGQFRTMQGKLVFAATRRDSVTGWGIIRQIDIAEIMAPIQRDQWTIWGIGALLFLSTILTARSKWNRDRHEQLRHAVERQRTELQELRFRQQAQAAESRANRLARLLDGSSEEIYAINVDTLMIEAWNQSAETSLGYDPASLARRTLLDLAPQLDAEEYEAALQQLRDGVLPRWTVETEQQRRDGTRYPVLLHIEYSTAEEQPVYVAIASDISDRRSLEAMLLQSQKMEAVGRLAGGIAHDFNNMLTVIQGCGTLALEETTIDSPAREDIEAILDAASRAAALTAQLLAFSRRQIMKPVVVPLSEIVLNIQPMLERLLGEDVQLVVRTTPSGDEVRVDRSQLDQVVMNLAINARDAMPHGGRLTLETTVVELSREYATKHPAVKPGPHAMLGVSDTGQGMDAETRAKIFEPFFTTKAKGLGTGLGLATVFGVVKQHAGDIWVYSEPGQGTTFKVYLPIVEASTSTPTIERLPLEVGASLGGTILLVEDDAGIRRLAARVLEGHGYTVIQASDGEEGLAVARTAEGPIHLLLTDVVMPRLGGRGLAERLMVRMPRLRVLYMSGFTDNAIVHHNILDEGLSFLQKPFTPDGLLVAVQQCLREH